MKYVKRFLLAAPVLLLAAAAHSADDGILTDDFYLAIGSFAYSADTELRIDGSAGEDGTTVDWERELGLDDKDSFRVDAFWRFAARHKMRLMYFENNRGSSTTLDRDIVIDGELFPVDATVRASHGTRIIELAYEYAFLQRDSYELSATAGLHLAELEPSIEITGSVNNAPVTVGQTRRAKLQAPLPVFGVRGLWRLNESFYLDAYAQYFQLEFGDSKGSILDYRVAVTWLPWSSFGLGLGYNEFSTRLDVDSSDFNGRLEWDYRGPQVFLVATF